LGEAVDGERDRLKRMALEHGFMHVSVAEVGARRQLLGVHDDGSRNAFPVHAITDRDVAMERVRADRSNGAAGKQRNAATQLGADRNAFVTIVVPAAAALAGAPRGIARARGGPEVTVVRFDLPPSEAFTWLDRPRGSSALRGEPADD